MKKIKCYSVRYEDMIDISDRAVLIKSYNGAKDVIPKSQIMTFDYDVQRSNAVWIAAWILEKKKIQYSTKKVGWFNEDGERLPYIKVTKHVPNHQEVKETQPDVSLIR